MELAILIPITLLGGFLYCKVSYRQFIKFHRYNDQHLYLQAALCGLLPLLISFLLAFLLLFLVTQSYPNFIRWSLENIINKAFPDITEQNISQLPLFTYTTSILIPFVSWLLAILSNLGMYLFGDNKDAYNKSIDQILECTVDIFSGSFKSNLRIAKQNKEEIKELTRIYEVKRIVLGNPLDSFFYNAYTKTEPVEITTNSNTIFIGGVLSIGEPNEKDGLGPEITIFPIASGYICQKTLKNRLNKIYPKHIREELPTYIRLDQIISARPFKAENYTKEDIDSPKDDSPQMSLI
ncbi:MULTISPECIES: hypothetical protein [Marinomonas]|uniref:Uncharacterized protein n=1 Tax=Marinomonas rhodophyticola TaxID=2992803 RepID=A0ABT3KGC8_9GAMM|nr:hypothetical protein [Marinomonas sp. KJ51-3]MCW4629587.1 hypothetical protein [Marinomonas sp. KJ51-3]